jgi:DNA-binding transcriptional MocR family regulator
MGNVHPLEVPGGRPRRVPRYREIARRFARAIEDGILATGERLPSMRQLREDEGVSISTVSRALAELEELGLVSARPKSGYYVRPRIRLPTPEPVRPRTVAGATAVSVSELVARVYRDAQDPRIVHLGYASPATSLLPTLALARTMSAVARRDPVASVAQEMPPGLLELRSAISRRALGWGCLLPAEDLVITSGATEAVYLSLLAVANRGDTVAIETPAHYGTLQAIESLGLKALEIPCDSDTGMDLDELERRLDQHPASAVVSVPNFSNPLGSCMPDSSKERLVRRLAARGVPLVEDDVYGDLAFAGARPRPAKAYDADGNVLYCGSFSKTLVPGYRVGFAAPGRFRDRFELLKFAMNESTPTITQRTLAQFLRGGGYDRHLRWLRARLETNVARISAAIGEGFPDGTRISRPRGGCFIWVELPGGVDALDLHARALDAGVSIAPGHIFSPSQAHRNCIRLNCGEPWSEQIEAAVRLVGRLASRLRPPGDTIPTRTRLT